MINFKSLAIGLVLGAALMFSTQSFANVSEKLEAVYANFNIVVNDNHVALEDSPVVINGKSYLPVKTIGNNLGYEVNYESESRTIEFNSEKKEVNSVEYINERDAGAILSGRSSEKSPYNGLIMNVKNGQRTRTYQDTSIALPENQSYYDRENDVPYATVDFYLQFLTTEEINTLPKYELVDGIMQPL